MIERVLIGQISALAQRTARQLRVLAGRLTQPLCVPLAKGPDGRWRSEALDALIVAARL